MEINKSTISEIVKKSGIKANKNLGQNFLIEPEISKKIVEALDIKPKEKILEIGPGLGSLTHYLVKYDNDIEIVDIDSRMTNFLDVMYKDNSNLKIVNEDVLKVNISDYDKIVSNVPYYITTELITKSVLKADKCKKMVFMIQKEAYKRFSSKVNEDGYSAIGVLISLVGEIKKIMQVSAGAFYPAPPIDSLVFEITFDLTKKNKTNFETYKLAKSLFLNKRKTILNNLTNLLKNKERSIKILDELGIDKTYRPENLSPVDYSNIYLLINSLN
ncbi:MAG: 16S rRNA (adenine(1518)-N(6)/adenine(1519)-N(6))-dimethyltransferase RsmA [Erysipelotrichaceae bacterium]|jgi:16S rRNA (adenine1518-N6/adenine1519-N6)-dimethyltransferase|nr:16S rRNA (adenine(1518)-N(6)/adenine(1519)-N(6))-dimethyltransferase RsmA [Erysipelotrichaceae bacterium]